MKRNINRGSTGGHVHQKKSEEDSEGEIKKQLKRDVERKLNSGKTQLQRKGEETCETDNGESETKYTRQVKRTIHITVKQNTQERGKVRDM